MIILKLTQWDCDIFFFYQVKHSFHFIQNSNNKTERASILLLLLSFPLSISLCAYALNYLHANKRKQKI